MEAIDLLELAQSRLELYHNRSASQQESLWYASKGENREMFTFYSSTTSPIHFHFSFYPRPCLLKDFFFFFFPFLGFYVSHFLPLFFTSLLFLSASLLPSYSSGGLISILSEHIIDSSCLPLVKMSFIIPCDSWLAGWLACWLTECRSGWLAARQSVHWPSCTRFKDTDN